jgi:heptosyltransferase I
MPPTRRLLLVKLSSLGDVIHNLPVVTDIRAAFPDALIDWVTEAPYASLVQQHPAINQVLPVHLRALKSRWYAPGAWLQLFDDKARIAEKHYQHIVDTQGLVKSALVGHWANGPISGYDRESVREPNACRWYQQRYAVSKTLHAVARNRALAAAALGYTHTPHCDYGLPADWPLTATLPFDAKVPYVVCLHASSRADKCWPRAAWVALGRALAADGLHLLLPSGTAAEFAQGEAITRELTVAAAPLSPSGPAATLTAVALRPQSLTETAAILANATAVVGVDTGLTHLAVALKRPTVGLYLTTQPTLTGLFGEHAVNLGGGTRERPAAIAPAQVHQQLRSMYASRVRS